MSNQYFQARSAVQQVLKNQSVLLANNHKTKMCAKILNGEICPFGSHCDFAHSETELRTKLCLFDKKGVCSNDPCSFDHSSNALPERVGFKPVHFTNVYDDATVAVKKNQICTKLRLMITRKYPDYSAFVEPIMNDLFQMEIKNLEVFHYNPCAFEDIIKKISKGLMNSRSITESPMPAEKVVIHTEFKSPVRYTSPYSFCQGTWGNDDEDDLADEIEATTELTNIISRYTPSPANELVTLKDITALFATLKPFSDKQGNVESETINGVVYNLYHINDVNIDSSDDIKAVRGIICKSDGFVVCKSFSFTHEFSSNSEYFNKFVPTALPNSIIVDSLEGTMVRLWFDNDGWTLSTHRKINAHKSRWNAKENIGTMFYQCLAKENVLQDDFHNRLNKNKVYVFQITNDKENRMVCSDSIRSIYSFGAFDKTKNFQYDPIETESGLTLPNKHNVQTVDEIKALVQSTDPSKKIGVSLLCNNGVIYKIVNDSYQKASEVRGSATNVYLRYLEVRTNKQKCKELYNLFPEKNADFDLLESNIRQFARHMYKIYKERFYTNNSQYALFQADQSTNCFNYVKCHKSHLKFIHDVYSFINGSKIKKPDFNLKHIWKTIDSMDITVLYHMVKHMNDPLY